MSGDTLRIRDALPRDLDDIAALCAQAVPHVTALDGEDLRRLLRLASIALIAEEDRHVRGYLLAFSSLDAYEGCEFRHFLSKVDPPFIFIDQVAVATAARGQGIARQLYERAQQVARRRGVFTLGAGVNLEPPNPASLGFFRKLDFEKIGEMTSAEGQRVALLRKLRC